MLYIVPKLTQVPRGQDGGAWWCLCSPWTRLPIQQPDRSLSTLVPNTSWFISWGERASLAPSFCPHKVSVMFSEGPRERDKSSPGRPYLHVELLPVTLCVFHQQLQRILVATLRLLAGHLGADVLLNLGMDDVACPQALPKQEGEQCGSGAVLPSLPPVPPCSGRSLLLARREPYPVEPAERHIDGQGEEVADHLLEGLDQLLLAVRAGLAGLEAQQDSHGNAKHEALHLGVHEQAGPGGAQPPRQAGAHLLLDDGHVVLQGVPGEGSHDHLPGGTRRNGTRAQPPRSDRPRPLPARRRAVPFCGACAARCAGWRGSPSPGWSAPRRATARTRAGALPAGCAARSRRPSPVPWAAQRGESCR